jgi:virulence-associated protein VagC
MQTAKVFKNGRSQAIRLPKVIASPRVRLTKNEV